jgi:hypothetical protein
MFENETNSDHESNRPSLSDRNPNFHADILLGGIAATAIGFATLRVGASSEYLPSLRTIGSLTMFSGLIPSVIESSRSAGLSFRRMLWADHPEVEI